MPTKKDKAPSTQQFLPIKEIKEGTVVMKDGSMRAAIMVSSLNFGLKNEEEKNAIVQSYQDFLNSLDFPIQISIRSRQLHLDNYLKELEEVYSKQTNELLKLQTAEYASFVEELLQYANIMEKRFFVIIPYYPVGLEKTGFLNKLLGGGKESSSTPFETNRMELTQRVEHVISGLSSVGLRCVSLNTEDLIELFYTAYNPDTSGEEKLHDVEELESPVITRGVKSA